jgi:TetR/AcrR family transcriptional repressor of nem operon
MAANLTREHLLEVGLERIHSTGYAATGVKEILDLAGVPKGSFYHYFPSKEAFAAAVLQLYTAGEMQRGQRILGDKETAPLAKLRRYFEELAVAFGPVWTGQDREHSRDGHGLGCLLGNMSLEVANHIPAMQSLLMNSFRVWSGAIAGVLREAMDQDSLPSATDPDALADFLLNGWEGAMVRMKAENSRQPIDNFLHFTFDVLLKK